MGNDGISLKPSILNLANAKKYIESLNGSDKTHI